MNRKIKFRLYCPHNKEMYYDDDENYELKIKNGEFSYIPLVDDSYCFYSNITDDFENDSLNIIPMQFTGLLDKDGKEIYEGDILENSNGDIRTVEWKWSKYQEYSDSGKFIESVMYSGFRITSKGVNDYKIIGNIYENNGKD